MSPSPIRRSGSISRPARIPSRRECDQAVDIGDRVIHAVDQRSRSRGLAVTAVVKSVSGEAGHGKPPSDVRIAPGVLTDAVSDDHHGTRRTRGQPCPPVDLGPRGTARKPSAYSSQVSSVGGLTRAPPSAIGVAALPLVLVSIWDRSFMLCAPVTSGARPKASARSVLSNRQSRASKASCAGDLFSTSFWPSSRFHRPHPRPGRSHHDNERSSYSPHRSHTKDEAETSHRVVTTKFPNPVASLARRWT